MTRALMQAIDSNALARELRRRGLTAQQVEQETGRAAGYINKALRRGTIALSETHLLEALYHITPETYFAKEEPEAPEEPEQIDMDALLPQEIQEAIYNSVLTMCKALTESATQLAGPMARIAAALEAQEEQDRVLPWNITDEEVGGPF